MFEICLPASHKDAVCYEEQQVGSECGHNLCLFGSVYKTHVQAIQT